MHAISEAYLGVLHEAGIESLDNLGEVAANFIIEHPLNVIPSISNALSEAEELLLMSGGALGLGSGQALFKSQNLT
jgi:hypothetical protein